MLNSIKSTGADIIFKSNIHQKFAVIDQRIVWYGSINLLSFGSAEESVMRLDSINIANELIGTIEESYKSGGEIVMGEFKIKEETNRVEFKQELNDKLEREVVSFLNYPEGGAIYIGIDNHGHVVGVANADDIQLKIKDRLKNNILPSTLGLFDVI